MCINDLNGKLINFNNIMHDKIIKQFVYDYKTSTLKLLFMDDINIIIFYSIDFYNVVGLDMTSCDFWGRSPHVDYFGYVEHDERKLLPKLYEEKNQTNTSSNCRLDCNKNYLEILLSFISGNIITIACEYMEFKKFQ